MNSRPSLRHRIAASVTILALLMSSTTATQAGITEEMEGLMNEMSRLPAGVAKGLSEVPGDLKGSIMANGPSAIHGQTYGTYMGGGAYARFPVRNLQLASIEMPHFSAGCGGIDMHFGSLSVIKTDKIVDFLKATAMNAVGVLTQVAISSITPMLGDALKWAMDKVDKINGFNLNSCQLAQQGVEGTMSAITASESSECINSRMIYDGMDRAEAIDECQTRQQMKEGLEKGSGPKLFYGNIVWELLKKTLGDANETKEERELIMSMIGTKVYHKDGAGAAPGASGGSALSGDQKVPEKTSVKKPPTTYVPTINHLSHLLYGNGKSADATKDTIPLEIFDCGNDAACLAPTKKTLSQGSFSAKVRNGLQSIADKIRSRQPLGAQEELIINQSSLPVMQMMQLGTAVKGSWLAERMIDKYQDVIAADFAYVMLARNIQAGTSAMKQKILKMSTPQEEDLKEMVTAAVTLRQEIHEQHEEFARKVADMSAIMTVMQNLERAMTSHMPDRVLALTGPGQAATGNK